MLCINYIDKQKIKDINAPVNCSIPVIASIVYSIKKKVLNLSFTFFSQYNFPFFELLSTLFKFFPFNSFYFFILFTNITYIEYSLITLKFSYRIAQFPINNDNYDNVGQSLHSF